MRVTIVTTTTPGALKPRTMSFAESLRRAGHHVRLVLCTDVSLGMNEDFDRRARQQLENRGFHVTAVETGPPPPSRVLRHMLTAGASSEVAAYADPGLARRVRDCVEAGNPDVVHVDRTRGLQLVERLDRPVVVDLTDPRGFLGPPPLRRDTARYRETMLDAARHLVDIGPARREERRAAGSVPCLTASPESARAMIESGLPAANVTAVPNATAREARRDPTPGRGRHAPRLAMTGNYRYAPNVLAIRDLQEALVYTRSGWIDRTLLIGAHGSRRSMVAARRLGFGLVVDVDSVPDALVREEVDVCVAPHAVLRGFPNRVVDAVYHAGKPIVVSAATARMLPPAVAETLPVVDAPHEFGCVLDSVLDSSTAESVEKAQAAIENSCDQSVVAEALQRVYARAVASHGKGETG
jgi:hypothetical protein